MQISKRAEQIIYRLNDAGHEAYVVGGCVRDLVMGKAPGDWDITTSATPERVLEIFSDLSTVPTGLKHGTVTVILEHEPFEVTTFRCDGTYADHRRPERVRFVSNLREDLARRDFTMNAIAYHPQCGLCDPFSGMADIEKKTIRAVGDPKLRFSEDALRILRALRFASCLGFTIENKTMRAARAWAPSLKLLARERITVEIEKLLLGENCEQVLNNAEEIFSHIFKVPIVKTGLQAAPKDLITRLAIAFSSAPENLKALCLPRDTQRRVERIIDYKSENARKAVRDLGKDAARYIDILQAKGEDVSDLRAQLERIERENLCCTLRELALSGSDLVNAGFAPGQQIGAILEKALDAVIEEKLKNDRDALLKYAFDIARDL